MLTIAIQGDEKFNEETQRFEYGSPLIIELEHSLVSLSKWEAIHHKPFLTKEDKTIEETESYIRCMVLTPGITSEDLQRINEAHAKQIYDYIDNPMTGTTFGHAPGGSRTSERISAELIHYWMDEYRIPYEAREWHLNQLFTLIRVHHAKSQPAKKMSKQANAKSMAEINAMRKAQKGTTG